eukprot:CAMPEP_0175662222 /NCGR_PEP_ID=MMETSP0097-20121207/15359_1 /TAXON_ID=311494 /ORGANISM="Alexandrium monilatum, Strain CCMP3105" /LENGTH=127 /DNA_ID=CAMNT_0016968411 /DNA_START=68 /DNA_END=449 /DNA_ORIENTATION=+
MASARRSSLAVIALFALALLAISPAFVPSAPKALAPSQAVAASTAVLGAAAPFALVEPVMAKEGDGTISGTEWAGYITLALVIFVFYAAQSAANKGKEAAAPAFQADAEVACSCRCKPIRFYTCARS